MKKITLLLLILGIAFIWACSKKDSTSSSPSSTTATTKTTKTAGTTSGTSTASTTSTTSTTSSTSGANCVTLTLKDNDSKVTLTYDSKWNLTKMVYDYTAGGSLSATITYNSSGQAVKAVSAGISSYQTFEYTGNQVTKFSDYDGTTLQDYSVYHYNSSGQVDKMTTYDASNKMTGYDVLTYDANGNVIRNDGYDGSSTLVSSTKYEYDTHKNILAAVNTNYIILRADFNVWGPNNCTKMTYLDSKGTQTGTDNTSYTYNSNGYPATAVASTSGNLTTTYTYDCH